MRKKAVKKVEETFTLKQAVEELKRKEEVKIEDRKVRLNEFMRLINEAEHKTNCTLQIDFNSPLNDLKIMPISKT